MSTLPNSWLAIELGDVIEYGKTEKAEPADLKPDTWVLELEDVEKETSKILARIPFYERQSKSTKNRFKAGDVLYGKLRPYLNKVVRADSDGVCTTEIIPLRGNDAVDSSFLFYWLKHPTFLAYVTDVSHGVNMPRLGTDSGKKAPFVLAPLSEQKRIVDKLDATLARVDACRERLARVTPLLKRFRQSVLAAATSGQLTADWREQQNSDATACKAVYASPAATEQVSSPCPTGSTTITADLSSGIGGGNLPADSSDLHVFGWKKVRFNNIGELGRGKSKHRPRNDPRLYGGAYPFIQTGDVTNAKEKILTHSQTYSELGLAQSKLWPEGTLCITIAANIADTAILTYPACFPDSVVGFAANDKKCNIKFIKWLVDVIKDDLERFAPATAQKNINLGILNDVEFLLPPLPEQIEIVRRVETLFAFADRMEARLASANAAANRLTPSLLAKAFRGELVPQDPSDEPASELLKRLAAQREATASKPKAKKAAV